MKTLTTILLLIIAFNINSQQELTKICFPKEKQAVRQIQRLKEHKDKYVLNEETNTREILRKKYYVCEKRDLEGTEHFRAIKIYCVYIDCEDGYLRSGYFNTLTIKKRHYKYLDKTEPIIYDNTCWLIHNKSRFQKYLDKTRIKRE